MNKRQAKKLARTRWKKFFAGEMTKDFLPRRKIKPSQVKVLEEHIPGKVGMMIKITGKAAGREICVKLIQANT